MINGKVWGNTTKIFDKNGISIHYLEIKPKSFCSKHKHDYKFNAFYVIDGEMDITVWKNDYKLTDVTTISKGQFTIVKPKEFHMFSSNTAVKALEIYYTETLDDDIIRETVGGIK